jgi:hypothetical protein
MPRTESSAARSRRSVGRSATSDARGNASTSGSNPPRWTCSSPPATPGTSASRNAPSAALVARHSRRKAASSGRPKSVPKSLGRDTLSSAPARPAALSSITRPASTSRGASTTIAPESAVVAAAPASTVA